MYAFDIKTAVQPFVPCIMKNGLFFVCYQSGVASIFDEHLVPLLDIAAHDKALVILVKLIEVVRDLLAARLYGKICLTVGNDFLARVAVLDDEIAGVALKFIIKNQFAGSFVHLDRFADLSKMIINVKSAVLACEFCFIQDLGKITPLGIV
jgi:hypothetical protein